MIKLFELEKSKIKPTEHCYTITTLKRIMDEYPEEHLSIYAYLFYKTCLNEELNPFANIKESEKEDLILEEVEHEFDPDDDVIQEALQLCYKLYDSPNYRFYRAAKSSIEKISDYLEKSMITDGRDGNFDSILKAQEKFDKIRLSFNETFKAFREEQNITSRGNNQVAYDQL